MLKLSVAVAVHEISSRPVAIDDIKVRLAPVPMGVPLVSLVHSYVTVGISPSGSDSNTSASESSYLEDAPAWGGYKRRSYDRKPWLKKVAAKVKARSLRYATQLKTCEEDLQKGWFMKLFT